MGLTVLDLSREQVLGLTGRQRSRVLNFFLRWERFDDLHVCLDLLIPANPHLVSLLDLRVRALLVQERADEALPLMEERLALRSSLTAQILLARVHLARGDGEAAHRLARALVEEHEGSVTAWRLLGEVELARGDTDVALSAYRRMGELSPHSRSYLLGMMALYQARDDRVTASGYAVRLLRTADAESLLPIPYLRRLRDYFQVSGEETRVADLEAELARRYADELAQMRAVLSLAPSTEKKEAVSRPTEREKGPPSPDFLPTLDQVAVSEEERAVITDAARRLFGFEGLLPGQLETIACVLRGEDVLTVLPTGGGKSLCYQLPALLAERGTTLVISPLIALMKDQVDSLPSGVRGRATTINSSLDRDALRQRLEQVTEGGYRLLYAAPERLRQPPFLHALRCAGINRLVIDEAHCVSVWGHDFRPDYLTIGQARRALGDPPLLAMTATAPPRVRHDVIQHLGDLRVIAGDVTRPNLRLEVLRASSTDDKLRHLLAFCRTERGSGIVYAGTRVRCEELAALLRRYGVEAVHYHAGIPDRDEVQDAFMAGRARVVVATVAFGLGIDKPDIRFIVHFVPPPSLESYYQEAGRAGRDGLPARCLLMYTSSDRAVLTRRARRDALSIQFLREVYRAVKRRSNGEDWVRVAAEDLERDLRADSTRVRVALSLLEKADLLRRGPDLPRAAVICLNVSQDANLPPDVAEFCRAARLRTGQPLTVDLVEIVHQVDQAELSLVDIERRVLDWVDAGWLSYLPAGRDWQLDLLPPPSDAAERIEMLLERYETIQAQRVDEISAYAQTTRCRHGYLNAYLGGRTIERCPACDNCVEVEPSSSSGLPDEREQLSTILRCVLGAPWSWGRRSLTRILRGNDRMRPGGHSLHREASESAEFGALAFRSRTAIERMLARLESGGFLQARSLEHGGVVLDLTARGEAALQDPAELDGLIDSAAAQVGREAKRSAQEEEAELDVDEDLFEALRAWRLEQARSQGVPPYVIFHDRHLRGIAAHRPVTPDALLDIKGVGPRKLERYGEAVLALVERHVDVAG